MIPKQKRIECESQQVQKLFCKSFVVWHSLNRKEGRLPTQGAEWRRWKVSFIYHEKYTSEKFHIARNLDSKMERSFHLHLVDKAKPKTNNDCSQQ